MLINNEQNNIIAPANVRIRRSRFEIPQEILTTFNSGDLIPLYINEILAGDTVSMDFSSLVRMSTPIFPTMDTAYMDVFGFYVPKRLVWDHFEEFMGANSNSVYDDPVDYSVPQIKAPNTGWDYGTVADQFGIPPKVGGFSVDALPFRAYAMIWNEWFRSNSITQPVDIDTGDSTVQGENASWSDYVTKGTLGGAPLRVSRFHDQFSSALPAPQAGPEVAIPLTGYSPVVPLSKNWASSVFPVNASGTTYVTRAQSNNFDDISAGTLNINSSGHLYESTSATGTANEALHFSNLAADLGYSGVNIPIDAMRKAVAIQEVLESINRGGSRFGEILLSCFGVENGDARLQRPEFLGAKRVPIQITEINQTSSTDATSPLGQAGATSKTLSSESLFTKSFTEPGYLFVLGCVRPVHTYSNGLAKFWRKRDRFDYYWPQLANISDSQVSNYEIFLQPDSVVDAGEIVNDLPFGYNEAWYEYRSSVNEVRGTFRPSHPQSLASWHYADNYSSLPTLSSGWLIEDGSNIGRTLAVQTEPQFLADFYFKPTFVRPMPVRSIPGLSPVL